MDKPTVHYVPGKYDHIEVGARALLSDVIDHPATDRVSNEPGQPVWTSTVVSIGENGAFETLNTLYVPGVRAS